MPNIPKDLYKLCPLKMINLSEHNAKCDEDLCAWYDKLQERCIIHTLANNIEDVTTALYDTSEQL